MYVIQARKKIISSLDNLMDFFWDIKKWNSFWSPMKDVEVLYDDGCFQEVNMSVDWQGDIHKVRTIRFKYPNEIHFFSPVPPPPTTIHQGVWRFIESGDGNVLVEANRHFTCSLMSADQINSFSKAFEGRIEKLLDRVSKRWIE